MVTLAAPANTLFFARANSRARRPPATWPPGSKPADLSTALTAARRNSFALVGLFFAMRLAIDIRATALFRGASRSTSDPIMVLKISTGLTPTADTTLRLIEDQVA